MIGWVLQNKKHRGFFTSHYSSIYRATIFPTRNIARSFKIPKDKVMKVRRNDVTKAVTIIGRG